MIDEIGEAFSGDDDDEEDEVCSGRDGHSGVEEQDEDEEEEEDEDVEEEEEDEEEEDGDDDYRGDRDAGNDGNERGFPGCDEQSGDDDRGDADAGGRRIVGAAKSRGKDGSDRYSDERGHRGGGGGGGAGGQIKETAVSRDRRMAMATPLASSSDDNPFDADPPLPDFQSPSSDSDSDRK